MLGAFKGLLKGSFKWNLRLAKWLTEGILVGVQNFKIEDVKFKEYERADLPEIVELFRETVYAVNSADYGIKQLDAWAGGEIDLRKWNESLENHFSFVALFEGRIVGFGDISSDGYLDRLYVAKDCLRRGVGNLLCERLEASVCAEKIYTHASITARPFFESRNYELIKIREFERGGVAFVNYLMGKRILNS